MRPVAAVVFGRRFGENGGDSIVGMVEGGPEARQREAVQPPVKKKFFYINDLSTFLYSFQFFDHTFIQVFKLDGDGLLSWGDRWQSWVEMGG
jgi:hypothetical protein